MSWWRVVVLAALVVVTAASVVWSAGVYRECRAEGRSVSYCVALVAD